MSDGRVIRRLAAVLAADVAGYSRLMGRDEAGTLAQLKAHRTARLEPVLARHGGRLVKLSGDGALAEFGSAVDAVSAAIAFQQAVTEANRAQPADRALSFRIGVHLGDLIVEGDDLYGDGVNIAARLEAEAPADGVMISRTVHEAVAGRIAARFEDGGERALKNIERPMQVFTVRWNAADWVESPATVAPPAPGAPLAPPERPSIAVLPFDNLSGDAEQEYFADGMVEDIITALSRFKSLFVIARNSSFTYKGKAVDIRQVGRELGVRYVLEGSVRKAANRVRITGQLIDSETARHLWADRFDGGIEDVFALQDRVTEEVVTALVPHIERAEIDRARCKPAGNLDAYDLYLRGLSLMRPITPPTVEEALRMFRRAIELDPGFSMPYGLMMACIANRRTFGLVDGLDADRAEIERLSRIVVKVGGEDAVTMAHAGWATAYVLRDLAAARQFVERALVLNANLTAAWQYSGWINLWQGNVDVAAEHLARGIRQDPQRSMETSSMRSAMAHACFFLGRYDEAIDLAVAQVRDNPLAHSAMRAALASAGFSGRADVAQSMRERLLNLDPSFRLSRLPLYLGPYPPALQARYAEGLRRGGVPE